MDTKATAIAEASKFVAKLNEFILFPLIYLLSSVALLYFIYGCAVYVLNADSDSAREEGRKHITYSIIGLVVMAAAFAILNIAAGTFGLNKQAECAANPSASGCTDAFKLPG